MLTALLIMLREGFGAGTAVHLTVENLTGEPRLLAFAAVSLLAVAVLTWMIFWMRRQAHLLKGELQHSVDQAIAGRDDVRFDVMTVSFLAVAREGLEAALFLIAAAWPPPRSWAPWSSSGAGACPCASSSPSPG